jgi:hypothetical protein
MADHSPRRDLHRRGFRRVLADASSSPAELTLVGCCAADRTMTELERLALLERQAEEAYDAMYEAHSSSHAGACYSDAKEALYSATSLAQRLGAEDAAKRLEARLAHIKAVFRSQFT